MLLRYKKAGGFKQLLHLLETCGPKKQASFLEIIEKEDSGWAEALRQKMLSVEKIFAWDDNTIGEVVARLPELSLATALHGIKPEVWERASRTLSHSQKRKIQELFEAAKPGAAEISSAFMKIIEEVRSMADFGYVHLEKIDANLVIAADIEEKLSQLEPNAPESDFTIDYDEGGEDASGADAAAAGSAPGAPAKDGDNAELLTLRKETNRLRVENQNLKREVNQLKDKLGKIHALAAL